MRRNYDMRKGAAFLLLRSRLDGSSASIRHAINKLHCRQEVEVFKNARWEHCATMPPSTNTWAYYSASDYIWRSYEVPENANLHFRAKTFVDSDDVIRLGNELRWKCDVCKRRSLRLNEWTFRKKHDMYGDFVFCTDCVDARSVDGCLVRILSRDVSQRRRAASAAVS